MIYFLKRADGAIKIGTTNDYRSRVNGLRSEHGDLELIGWMDGGRDKEVELHAMFTSNRVGRSEWFTDSEEIAAYISTNAIKTPPKKHSKVVVQISQYSQAILDYVIMEHYAKTQQRLSYDGALWKLFENGAPEAVERVKTLGCDLPEDVRYDARSRHK